MGLVKLNGTTFPDRRTNGARIKLDVADWIKISITIFTTFAIITFGAGKLLTIVNNHTEVLASQGIKLNKTTELARDNYKDIESMRESIDRIDKNVLSLLKRK